MAARLVVGAALLATASADIYLQMPRGSNNRLDGENRDRDNANRMFDSQNNNRGGYNVGSVYYHAGSEVPMEWTAQHSCGHENSNCEIIVQYMCDDKVRDGTTERTIPDNPHDCYNFDCDSDPRYGRHESYDYYTTCKNTERNMGLFTANQNPRGSDARYTRQNPNGGRRGYECPEERDYYPYWRPTPWKDLAVMTNQPGRCEAYKRESENVKGRYYCDVPQAWVDEEMWGKRSSGFIPINKVDCEQIIFWNEMTNTTELAEWRLAPAHGGPELDCRDNQWSRDNHLGNVEGGQPASYNWTIPDDIAANERCVLRIRYNISTNDFEHFGYNDRLGEAMAWGTVDSLESTIGAANSTTNTKLPADVDVWSKFGMTKEENAASFDISKVDSVEMLKESRGYVLKNNPNVNIFGSLIPDFSLKLQLAVNTAQFGRTFQDRTHRFAIRPRPSGVDGRIHNLQVRGKRGNIVQTFPGTEYDFFPNRLHVKLGDYVHMQWTGSNTNPNNNAGQGRHGSDRHNIVVLRDAHYMEVGQEMDTWPKTKGQWGNSYPAKVTYPWPFLGFSQEDQTTLAVLDTHQFGGEMSELDDAGTYFDLGPRRVTQAGIYHYLCTRNNNFSNRSQKGKIVVDSTSTRVNAIGRLGGTVKAGPGSFSAEPGALGSLELVSISSTPADAPNNLGRARNGDFVTITPVDLNVAEGMEVKVQLDYNFVALAKHELYWSESIDGEFRKISADFSMGTATAEVTTGGVFVVSSPLDPGLVFLVVALCVAVVAGLGWVVYAKKTGRNIVPCKKDSIPTGQI